MAFCTFGENYTMFDITPVDNLFIQEFMLKAPGDFVKVYLYGLKQCYHPEQSEDTIDSFARALGLETGTAEDAFRYWERQGLLKKKSDNPLSFEYYNLKDILYNKNFKSEKNFYQYKDFNQNVQLAFGSRLLQPQEFQKIYDWIEILSLPCEVVMMIIQLCISKKGKNVSLNYIDKVAAEWTKEGINSIPLAEDYLRQKDLSQSAAYRVLKQLGIHRLPSVDENKLVNKWLNVYGFTLDAVLYSCRETTKIQSPNMAYLDKIIENYYKLNIKTSADIKNYLDNREQLNNLIKDVLYELGSKDVSSTYELQAMYIKWTKEWNFTHDVIKTAARYSSRNGSSNFESVDNILNYWMSKNLMTQKDISDYLNKSKQIYNELKIVFDRASENRKISLSDKKLYTIWTEEWQMSFELVLQAAEYSQFASNKMVFMNKILENWHSNNITTIAQAKADHEKHIKTDTQQKPAANKMIKQLDAYKFKQRQYTEEELDSLFDDLDNE